MAMAKAVSPAERQHFVVIGSMKSGTTSLYQHLLAHPDIGMSRMKETDYFVPSMNLSLGQKWYDKQFPEDAAVTGEVSPNYTKHDAFPGVPEQIAAYAPEAKLIFLARDPVDRFVSQYKHALSMGHADVSPEDLLASDNGNHMLETSRYAAQLETFLKVFSRDQLLILDFKELVDDPQSVINEVTTFLGVAPLTIGDIATNNDAQSIAAMPGFVQRFWRSKFMRRIDPLISRQMRDTARRLLSRGKAKPLPSVPQSVRDEAAALLREDAAAFRVLSGKPFADWKI